MKKTANIVGFLAAFFTVAAAIFKINHLPGANGMLIISGAVLAIYFPVYITNRLADANGGKSLPMHYIAGVAISLIQISVVFKIQRWPGSAELLIIGILSFALLYLPLLLKQKMKQEAPDNFKIIYISGFIGAAVLSLGILFKILHWPMSMPLTLIGAGLLFLIYFPMYVFNYSKNREDTYVYLRDIFFSIVIGGILSIFIITQVYNRPPAVPSAEIAKNISAPVQ